MTSCLIHLKLVQRCNYRDIGEKLAFGLVCRDSDTVRKSSDSVIN